MLPKSLPMFRGLRWQLLLSYLLVMAAIISVFGMGVFAFFTRSLYRQLDAKLQTLAQSAAPSLTDVKKSGPKSLDQVSEFPWRDIFNRNLQSLEWFDAQGNRLATKGSLYLEYDPRLGAQTVRWKSKPGEVRTFTISVHSGTPDDGVLVLQGYLRASQSLNEIRLVQSQLLWGVAMGGTIALGLVAVGGLWLTQRALVPIEESFLRLKQFTADASHELRSPLTVISTSAGVMLNHPERVHPKDAKKLTAIASAARQMSVLVEDLLFLARADAANPVPKREWTIVAVDQVLADLIEMLADTAQSRGITLNTQAIQPLWIQGNIVLLSRLFSNLLRNAVQYTPPGGTISLAVTKQYQVAVISVEDTGIGIARDQIPLIFNRFWRADRARSRRESGMGLGLAIAQSIVKQHRGKIVIKSEVGKGSCFQVHLPLGFRSPLSPTSYGLNAQTIRESL